MVIVQQKTGYYVTNADGGTYSVTDAAGRGHSWFSKPLARQIARQIGGMYEQGNRTTIKDVVTALDGDSVASDRS